METALPERSDSLRTREPILNYADAELCGKWKVLANTVPADTQVLEKLLQHWFREGSKVLIFSYSVRLLKMLDYLMIRNSYTYASLHGAMDLEERTATVDQFNNDPYMFVFLISTKAGGVGLNIVSANKVYSPSSPAISLLVSYSIQIGTPRTIYKPKTGLFVSDNVEMSKYIVSSRKGPSRKSSMQDRYINNSKRI